MGLAQNVKDVPSFMLADGNPTSIYGLNIVGLRRNEIDPEVRRLLKKAYRILYRSNLSLESAIERIEKELEASYEVKYLVNFLKNSKRIINQILKRMKIRIWIKDLFLPWKGVERNHLQVIAFYYWGQD